jgi:hypothetical protein
MSPQIIPPQASISINNNQCLQPPTAAGKLIEHRNHDADDDVPISIENKVRGI